jgi:hypothetical protein
MNLRPSSPTGENTVGLLRKRLAHPTSIHLRTQPLRRSDCATAQVGLRLRACALQKRYHRAPRAFSSTRYPILRLQTFPSKLAHSVLTSKSKRSAPPDCRAVRPKLVVGSFHRTRQFTHSHGLPGH